MAYTKMTVADFKQRLKNGDYKDATGARRGAGKADLTSDEKDQCRRAIDKHFGVDSSAAASKKTVAKKPKATSKKVAKRATAANGKVEHKSNGAHPSTEAKTAKKSAGKGGRGKRRLVSHASEGDSVLLAHLHLTKERIGTIAQMVEAMNRAKDAYSGLDTKDGMMAAGLALTEIMQGVHKSLKVQLSLPEIVDPQVMETLAKTVPASVGLPGQESPVQIPQQPPQDAQSIS